MAETVSSKKNKNQEPPVEMSFWDHLDALRGHLFRSAIAVLVFSIAAFFNREFIFDKVILAPKESNFISNQLLCRLGTWLHIDGLCFDNFNIQIINLNLSGQFSTHMSISFFTGLILAFPYVIWEIWRFLKPALYPNERRYTRGAVFIMSALFLIGVLFSYFLIVPLTLNFFGTYKVSDMIANQISLSSYISTLVSVVFSVGIVFELPVFVYFLTKVGIVTPEFLRRTRKYMIVIILTIAAIITPPDILSQILVSIPLFALYEVSILVSSRISKKSKLAE
ncbi:MAG: twin-arginine translocase subunit TatC [Omnitrophica WOR_2 bacterium]